MITIDEYNNAEKLLHEKLRGLESRPMAIVMLASAVWFLVKTRFPEDIIRALVERALAKSRGEGVVMPTPAEVIELTGQVE